MIVQQYIVYMGVARLNVLRMGHDLAQDLFKLTLIGYRMWHTV